MAGNRAYQSGLESFGFGDLFSSQQQREDACKEKLEQLTLEQLFPFKNHPFGVRDDAEMEQLVESIRSNGVNEPLLARPKDNGYEIISGHRRYHAAKLAGLETVPVRICNVDDDTAIIQMVDANLHRQHILPSEKAKAYQMKLEAIKRQGKRNDLTSPQLAAKLRSDDIVASDSGTSGDTVRRIIRLTNLIPELQQLVDENKLKMTPAVELSYLSPEQQEDFFTYIQENDVTPSLHQAQKLKAASKEDDWSLYKLEKIMTSQPPSVKERDTGCLIPRDTLSKYFPETATNEQILDIIIRLLESRKRQHEHGPSR